MIIWKCIQATFFYSEMIYKNFSNLMLWRKWDPYMYSGKRVFFSNFDHQTLNVERQLWFYFSLIIPPIFPFWYYPHFFPLQNVNIDLSLTTNSDCQNSLPPKLFSSVCWSALNVCKSAPFSNKQLVPHWSYFLTFKSPHLDLLTWYFKTSCRLVQMTSSLLQDLFQIQLYQF